jgi:hypothetical protein
MLRAELCSERSVYSQYEENCRSFGLGFAGPSHTEAYSDSDATKNTILQIVRSWNDRRDSALFLELLLYFSSFRNVARSSSESVYDIVAVDDLGRTATNGGKMALVSGASWTQ